ncbi:hypothetical protein RSAG8_13589, partial [Rhizoctonia solani AG-8 WAC10335]
MRLDRAAGVWLLPRWYILELEVESGSLSRRWRRVEGALDACGSRGKESGGASCRLCMIISNLETIDLRSLMNRDDISK